MSWAKKKRAGSCLLSEKAGKISWNMLASGRSNGDQALTHKLLILILTLLATFYGITAEEASLRYKYRSPHDPDGIGKFYMGREIAQVMGCSGADWLERAEREREERASLLVELLRLQKGQNVADIGAGSGYFSLPMAKLVGPKGGVLAVDIQTEMLDLIRGKMGRLGIENVEPTLGTETDPGLPPRSLDLVLMVDVYHEFSHPWEMMQKVCQALKPEGRVVFVEYRGEDPSVPIKRLHKMTEKQVKQEMTPHPLRWLGTIHRLPRQHVILFAKIKEQK